MTKATDRRTAATRAALIECAEMLFAEHGVDGVSLRQIATASGSANTNVVAYHFGSKEALVEAVIHHRLPGFEQRRAELAAAAPEGDLVALCDALWRPFLEQVNAAGRHSYAGFLAGLMRSNQLAVRAAMSGNYPVTQALFDRIAATQPHVLARRLASRVSLLTMLIASALQLSDENALSATDAEAQFADTVAMAAAALAAPFLQPESPTS